MGRILGASILSLLAVAFWAGAQPRPATIGFVGVWDRAEPMIDEAARSLNLRVSFYKPGDLARDEAALGAAQSCQVLFVLNLEPGDALTLSKRFAAAKVRLIALDTRGSHAEFQKAGILVADPEIPKYW